MSARQPSAPPATAIVSHDYSPPPRPRRRLQVLAATSLGAALLASVALQLAHDHRQLAGRSSLKPPPAWGEPGLQVALRAVADGRDTLDAEGPAPLRR
jgi:hypothetical protein